MLFFGNQTAAEQAPIGADEVIGHGASENRDGGAEGGNCPVAASFMPEALVPGFCQDRMRENAGQLLAGQALSAHFLQPTRWAVALSLWHHPYRP